jgi:hypothetical protein
MALVLLRVGGDGGGWREIKRTESAVRAWPRFYSRHSARSGVVVDVVVVVSMVSMAHTARWLEWICVLHWSGQDKSFTQALFTSRGQTR